MVPFPNISPEIFTLELGPIHFALRWYALAYIAGLLLGWFWIARMLDTPRLWREQAPMSRQDLDDLLTYVILGVIIGGRLVYVVFYNPNYYLSYPLDALKIWQGGMSFHGGFLGVVFAVIWLSRTRGLALWSVADLMAVVVPIGLGLGRFANFINAELWGRPTQMPWGVVFPGEAAQNCPDIAGLCARHPSQLYEAALEGGVLLIMMVTLVYRRQLLWFPGRATGIFLVGYGISRSFVELFRQPDAQFTSPSNPIGYAWQFGDNGLTMGQILSLPMIAVGVILILRSRQKGI